MMLAKKKSSLMTPDPYHTPGYCGYVPQFKYDMGQTFGIHTHKLLTSSDPKVASSGNPVLCEIFPDSSSLPSSTNEEFSDSPVYKNMARSWGDQKYMPHMLPGYSGYIPKGWQYFGSRYAESCHTAISSFEADQHKYQAKMDELKTLTGCQTEQRAHASQMATPLLPKRAKAKTYYSGSNTHQYVSPHCVPEENPKKYFMSGYMGFVPKSQRYLGQGYPIITGYALAEHANEMARMAQSAKNPVEIHRPPADMMSSVLLYPKKSGLVPRYTGHIPGLRFKHGGTYGSSTRDALRALTA